MLSLVFIRDFRLAVIILMIGIGISGMAMSGKFTEIFVISICNNISILKLIDEMTCYVSYALESIKLGEFVIYTQHIVFAYRLRGQYPRSGPTICSYCHRNYPDQLYWFCVKYRPSRLFKRRGMEKINDLFQTEVFIT